MLNNFDRRQRFGKINKACILIIIWVMSQGCYSLIDVNFVNPVAFVVGCMAILLVFFPSCLSVSNNDPFRGYWIAFLLLLLVEVFQSCVSFGEPFILAVKQLIYLIPYVLYFPIRAIIMHKDNYEYVEKGLIWTGIIACMISYILYFNGGSFAIFSAQEGMRDEEYTVLFCNYMIILSSWLIIGKIFESDRIQIKWIIVFVFMLMNFVMVMRYRGQALGIIAACIVAFAFSKDIKLWKKILILVAGMLVILFTNNVISSMLLDAFTEIKNQENTFGVRVKAYDYFISEWKNHPLLGYGGISLVTPYRTDYSQLYSFFTSDVGIVGWIYKYGLAGIVFYIYFLYAVFKCGIVKRSDSRKIDYFTIAYIGYRLSTIMTLVYFDYSFQGTLYIDIFAFSLMSVRAEKAMIK